MLVLLVPIRIDTVVRMCIIDIVDRSVPILIVISISIGYLCLYSNRLCTGNCLIIGCS